MLSFSVYHVCVYGIETEIKLFKVGDNQTTIAQIYPICSLGEFVCLKHMRVIVRRHQHLPIFKQISKYKINELSTAENVLISCRLGCCL